MNQLFDLNLNDVQRRRFFNAVLITVVLLAIFLGVKAVNAVKEYTYIGAGVYPTNTITVSGTGEVFSIPDTGSFSFSVVEEGDTVKVAQDKASEKVNTIIAALKDMNIDENDIKTTNYSSGPKYEWKQESCTRSVDSTEVSLSYYNCPSGKNVLIGYEVSHTVSVKVRNTDDAGAVLTKVGELKASNISSLSFVVDDEDAVKAEARDEAIANAKEKAKTLAKSLHIKLVRIVSFNESGDYPVYYGVSAVSAKGMEDGTAVTVPEIPVGENKTVSNVSITYEIR